MKIITFLLMVMASTAISAGQQACRPTDVAIVVEVPTANAHQSTKALADFTRALSTDLPSCHRYALAMAGSRVQIVRQLQCDNALCNWKMLKDIGTFGITQDRLGNSKASFVFAIDRLYDDVFKNGRNEAAKVVVLVPATGASNDATLSVADSVKLLHEDRIPILVLAVGDGQQEELKYLAFEDNRILRVASFEEISQKALIQSVMKLISNPDDVSHMPKVRFAGAYGFTAGIPGVAALSDMAGSEDVIQEEEKCSYIVDIGFLIDSSNSIKIDYQKQLLFVQRIASRFGISESGSHAGVIIFSDVGYVNMTIKMNDFYTTKDFNEAVMKSPFFGWRTRIDLAFDVAHKQLFTLAGGARPNMRKIIFLITDGFQNPTKEKDGTLLDPIAASRPLYDAGVAIFAVGIGTKLNKVQLNEITRSADRVYYAETIDLLISDEFVKNVSKRLCQGGKLMGQENVTVNCTTQPVKKCEECCCGGGDVYINIFQSGSGPNYVMQGARITQTGNTAQILTANPFPKLVPALNISSGPVPTTEQLINIIKESLSEHNKLTTALNELLTVVMKKTSTTDRPGTNIIHKRKRRSLSEDSSRRMDRVPEILNLAKASGCKTFVDALETYGITDEIMEHVHMNGTVTVFCPVDEAISLNELYPMSQLKRTQVKDRLRYHVAVKHDEHGTMYRSFAAYSSIVLHPLQVDRAGQSSWMVEDARIKFSMRDGDSCDIVIIEKMLTPPALTLKKAIKNHPRLTQVYNLIKKIENFDELLLPAKIEKVCFVEDLCVGLSPDMKTRVQDALRFSQMTMIAPSDDVLSRLSKSEMKALHSDKAKLTAFLRRHFFLGAMRKVDLAPDLKVIAQPIDDGTPVSVLHRRDRELLRANADNQMFKLTDEIRVREGILLVEDPVS